MGIAFDKFIDRYYPGLRILNIATDDYLPGSILNSRTLRLLGNVSNVLKGPASQYTVKTSEANMVYGEVSGSKSLKGGANLLGLVSLSGSFSKEIEANYTITDIRGAIQQNLPQIVLQPKLQALRQSDKDQWKLINNQLVVTEVYYANSFVAKFTRSGKVLGQADLSTQIHISPNASYEWSDSNTLVITENSKVPFGVRGFKL